MHIDHLANTLTGSFTLPITSDYGYVLIVAVAIAFEILLIGFAFPGKVRGEIFTEEYMKSNFGEEHRKATGVEIEKGGYPDMGNGRYSSKLTYEQWYKFNNAQRAHYNFVEFAPSGFVMLFIAGIYFPIAAAVLGLVLFIGRIFYSYGYANGGPKGRLIGAILNDLVLLGLLGLSLASGIMFAMGKSSL